MEKISIFPHLEAALSPEAPGQEECPEARRQRIRLHCSLLGKLETHPEPSEEARVQMYGFYYREFSVAALSILSPTQWHPHGLQLLSLPERNAAPNPHPIQVPPGPPAWLMSHHHSVRHDCELACSALRFPAQGPTPFPTQPL